MTTLEELRSAGRTPSGPPGSAMSALRAVGVAVFAGCALVATYVVMVKTARGQAVDQAALDHLGRSAVTRDTVSTLLAVVTVGAIALVLAGCVLVAAVRRRWSHAAAAVVLVAGAVISTELLKTTVLTRPELGHGHLNSLPSGHTTVVASLVLAGLLVVPHGGRWLVALVGATAVAVTGVGTVVAGWHRPSDVAAALAVALAWGALVLAGLTLRHGPEPTRRPSARPLTLVAALAVAAALFVALGVRPAHSGTDLFVHVVIMGGLGILSATVVGLFCWMVDARLP